MSKRTFPTSVTDWSAFTPAPLRDHEFTIRLDPLGESTHTNRRPVSAIEALMLAEAHSEPEESIVELQVVREAVADCIDLLDPQDRFVIEAVEFERISQREVADRLGLAPGSHADVVRQARQNLRVHLLRHPTIRERLGMTPPTIDLATPSTWDAAARRSVELLTPSGNGAVSERNYQTVIARKIDLIRHIIVDRQETHLLRHPIQQIGSCAAELLATAGLWDVDATVDLLCRKQHDYGPNNILSFGHIGIGVRLSDKVARYFNLAERKTEGRSEPLVDALLDMVGYAVVDHMLWEDWFELPLEYDLAVAA